MPITNNLGQTKVGVRTGVLAQQVSYLLDTYSGAAAAYSLRKLRNSYTGSAIRVRRSNDNNTIDIGFDANGNLDTTSMLNFVAVNQILYSEEFDNAYWTKNGVTVTSNSAISPDGTMTADLITESGNTNHSIRNATTTSYPIGTNYNFSVYVKKESVSSPDTFALSFADGNISSTYVLFNILNGSVVETYNYYNDSNFGSSIEDVGNGWFRCSVWGTSTISSNRQTMSIRFTNTSTVNFGYYPARTTAKMYIWGYQMTKLGTDLQPYNKTTTITAGNGFVSIWYDQSSTYDASQQASASQPQIVSAGSVITKNGKPTIKFDGVDDFLVTGNYSFVGTDKIYVAYVATALTNTGMVVGHYKTSSPSIYMLGYRNTGRSLVQLRNSTNTTSYVYTFNLFNANQYLYEKQFDLLNATSTSRIVGWRNGVSDPMNTNGLTTTALPTFTQPISIGAEVDGASNRLNGDIQEIILYYNQDKSNDRAGIASDINTHYSIY